MHTSRLLGLATVGIAGAAALVFLGYRAGRHNDALIAPSVASPTSAPTKTAPPAKAVDPVLTYAPPAPSDAANAPKSREDLITFLRVKLSQAGSPDEVKAFLANLAKTDPMLAVDLAQTVARNDTERAALVAGAVQSWAAKDPQSAWDWTLLQSHRLDSAGETPLISVVLAAAAAKDPAAAVVLAESALKKTRNPNDINPSEIATATVQALLESNHTDIAERTVEQWAKGPLKDDLGNAPYETVALKLAEVSPTAATSWLQSLPPSDARNFALATAAAAWAATDPKAALDWASSLTPNAGRDEAMQRAFNRWVSQDKVTAAQWLGEHESDPSTDRMISNFATDSPIGQSNPRLALEWVELISDPTLRVQSLQEVVRSWAETDVNAATRYVSENKKLTDQEKQRLIQSLSNRPQNPG